MKKDLTIHLTFALAFFVLVSLYRNWLNLAFFPFWFGALLGTLLPDVDYLLYVYLLKPKDTASAEIATLVSQKKILKTWDMLVSGFADKEGLLIHNASFQVLFLIFTILIVTSGNLLGMGVVLGFMLHLIMDQFVMLTESRLDGWFRGFLLDLSSEQKRWFIIANVLVIVYLGFFF